MNGNDNPRDLAERLRALRVDPATGGVQGGDEFGAALHRRLVEAGPPPALGLVDRARAFFRERPGIVWLPVGVASGVAAFVLLTVLRAPAPTPAVAKAPTPTLVPAPPVVAEAMVPEPSFQVPAAKVAVIKLSFTADVAVEDVTFDVALPEGLAFWSHGERLADRSFSWKGRLDAGENPLPIAVRGDKPGLYRVKASALVGGQRVEHEVVLEVTAV